VLPLQVKGKEWISSNSASCQVLLWKKYGPKAGGLIQATEFCLANTKPSSNTSITQKKKKKKKRFP
jgi:hypothetical protein